jgi:hypothetical protein
MIEEKGKQSTLRQMFWAGIWIGGRTELVEMSRVNRARDYSSAAYCQALEEGLMPWNELKKGELEEIDEDDDEDCNGFIFMQDNAPIHRSRFTMDWLKQHKVEVMTWPPYLSDMNPMEHLWWILKQRLVELFPDLKGNGFTVAERAHFVDCT